ncbi:hypothetical protein FIBSPDRAFT_900049 [Athelia psychrophila]|uniref:Uncharacterized protein n=1 Tax=Athelia psychrophila TaxID=1759441 RepID=A0A165YWJ8_9AGAM|nr:hypothetical protein FIBSPDRAFT_900049 [Fibularhizoctonia sp. CBS 109695]
MTAPFQYLKTQRVSGTNRYKPAKNTDSHTYTVGLIIDTTHVNSVAFGERLASSTRFVNMTLRHRVVQTGLKRVGATGDGYLLGGLKNHNNKSPLAQSEREDWWASDREEDGAGGERSGWDMVTQHEASDSSGVYDGRRVYVEELRQVRGLAGIWLHSMKSRTRAAY